MATQGGAGTPPAGTPPTGPAIVVMVDTATNTVKLPADAAINNMRVEGNDLVLQQADGSLIIIKDAALKVPTFLIGPNEIPATVVMVDPATNTVELPADAAINNMRMEGNDLVLEQADGSLIIIKDAALNVPTFLIGANEIPRDALLAALEAAGLDVAFGADGTVSVTDGNSKSSGGDFDIPPGGIGPGLDYIPTASVDRTDIPGTGAARAVSAAARERKSSSRGRAPTLAGRRRLAVDEAALFGGTNPAAPARRLRAPSSSGEGDGQAALFVNGVNVTNGGTDRRASTARWW